MEREREEEEAEIERQRQERERQMQRIAEWVEDTNNKRRSSRK